MLLLVFQCVFNFAEVEILASTPLENVKNILASCLKVGSSIVRLRDEELTSSTIVIWMEHVADLNEFLFDWPQEIKTGLDLGLWVVCLNSSGNHANKPSLGGHLGGGGHHGHINVGLPAHLLLRDDDLGGQGVLGVGHWVVHQTDAANHLANLLHLVTDIGGVTINLLAFCHLTTRLDSYHFPALHHYFIDRLVQHVCPAIDSGEPGKTLWQFTQSI